MENANPTKNPVTTIIGIVLIAFALFVWGATMFFDVKEEFTKLWWVPILILISGFLFVLSPDTLVYGVKKGIDKASNEKV
jgi:hypothetical protein